MAINLGDINFGLGPDTRRLENARREVVRFGQAVNQAAADQGDGARRTEAAMRRQEKAMVDTFNKILKLNDAIRKTKIDPAYFNTTTNTFERLVREMGRGQVSALQFQRSMEDVSTSLTRTSRAIDQNVQAQERKAKAQADAAKKHQQEVDYLMKVERTLAHATRQVDAYNAAVARTKAPAGLATGASGALGGLKGSLGGGMLDPVAFQRASLAFQNAMNKNTIALRNFQKHGDQTAISNSLDRLANISVLLHGPLSGIASRFALIASVTDKVSLKVAALVTGISAAGFAFVRMGENAIASAKIFQRTEQALDAVYGSTKLTAGQMEYLMGVSDRSGKSFDVVANQFTRITAASQGTNLEGERTRLIFERILFAGSKMGASNEEVAGTLRALEQIMSKGTVQAEELRGQLGDRLPGAFNIMADALGLTTKELTKLMEQGKITADALLPFSEELARRYGVDVTKGVNTLAAAEGRLTNAFLRFGRASNEAIGFSDAYLKVLNSLAGGVDFLGKNIITITKLLVAGAAAMTGFFGPQIVMGIIGVANALKMATLAMLGLNAATLANPFGKLLQIILRLSLAVAGFLVGMKAMEAFLGGATDGANQLDLALESNEEALRDAAGASSLFRKTLEGQMKMQKQAAQAALAEASAQLQATRAKVESMRDAHTGGLGEFLFGPGYKSWALQDAEGEVNGLTTTVDSLTMKIKKLDGQMASLSTMPDAPIDPLGDGSDSESGVNRVAKALREAAQATLEARTEYDLLMVAPGQRPFIEMQDRINQQVQDFKDKLIDAKVPMGDVNAQAAKYLETLTLLEEKQLQMEYFPDMWEELSEVLGAGMDQAMGAVIDSWMAGEDALKSLMDVGRMVAADLIKTFAQMAVINPLKNILFGGDSSSGGLFPTFNPMSMIGGLFGLGGGGAGAGGGLKLGYNLPGFAGGGEFAIPGGGGGLDNQLVQFMGSPGETVSISKRGHSGGGSDSDRPVFAPTFILNGLAGNEEVVGLVKSAVSQSFTEYENGSMARLQKNMVRAKSRRIKGVS